MLRVKAPVMLIHIMTKTLRADICTGIGKQIEEGETTLKQIDFQTKFRIEQASKQDIRAGMEMRGQVEAEKKKIADSIEALKKSLEEAEKMDLGVEMSRGQIESEVKLEVGQKISEQFQRMAVVIKDDEIVEIRGVGEDD